uniref:Uncharacterized protein n=1 Tax=Rhizobium rhizogenes TaxID=359 RepID=A0A7S4ZSL1_RHIRH|nr:hypothetical protein pC5.7c_540 [Rhizobium rhizogenes]
MEDNEPAGRQHILDYPQAERETEITPHDVGNDFRRKAMAAIMIGHRPSSNIGSHVPLS